MLHKRLFKIVFLSILFIFSIIEITVSLELINNVPESLNFFVGRSDILEEMQDILLREKQLSLVGIGGVGKTEIVRKFVQDNKDKFRVIWSIDCDNDIRYQLKDLARTINYNLGSKEAVSEDIDTVLGSVISFLNNYGKFLLILDNFKINNQNQAYDFIRSNSNGYSIVLSRTKDNLPNVIEVSCLNEEESEKLFKLLYPRVDIKLKEEIIDKFKGYPLVMVRALHFLRQYKYINFYEYKDIHNNEHYLENIIHEILNKSSEQERKLFILSSLINNHDIDSNFMKAIGIKRRELLLLNSKMLLTKIKNIKINDNLEEKYEMHDLIKETLLKVVDKHETKENFFELLDKITEIFPYAPSKLSTLQKEIPSLISQLDTIYKNSKDYNIPIKHQLGIQSLRLGIFMLNHDYEAVDILHKWFKNNYPVKKMDIKGLNIYQLKALIWAFIIQSEYEDIYLNNTKLALDYLYKSKHLLSSQDALLKDVELNFELYAHMAQTLLYVGNIENAEEYIGKVDKYVLDNKPDIDVGFYWFLKSKIAEQNSLFKEAREYIDKSIDADDVTIGFNLLTAPSYLLKADICLSDGAPEEAYLLSKKVYELSENLDDSSEFKGETLVKLARSELALNKPNYKKNAHTAFKLLSSILPNNGKTIKELIDSDLAEAYILLGDIDIKEGNINKAIENYVNGLTIFRNRYEKNLKNYNIHRVLYKIINLFIEEKRFDEANFFIDEYTKIFGKAYPHTLNFYEKMP